MKAGLDTDFPKHVVSPHEVLGSTGKVILVLVLVCGLLICTVTAVCGCELDQRTDLLLKKIWWVS